MAQPLKPCCERTLREARRRYQELATSYPVIKDFPCTACSTVLKLRLYGPPEEEEDLRSA
jgi:hypothetical protein